MFICEHLRKRNEELAYMARKFEKEGKKIFYLHSNVNIDYLLDESRLELLRYDMILILR